MLKKKSQAHPSHYKNNIKIIIVTVFTSLVRDPIDLCSNVGTGFYGGLAVSLAAALLFMIPMFKVFPSFGYGLGVVTGLSSLDQCCICALYLGSNWYSYGLGVSTWLSSFSHQKFFSEVSVTVNFFWTLLGILADLSCAVFWIVSTLSLGL